MDMEHKPVLTVDLQRAYFRHLDSLSLFERNLLGQSIKNSLIDRRIFLLDVIFLLTLLRDFFSPFFYSSLILSFLQTFFDGWSGIALKNSTD